MKIDSVNKFAITIAVLITERDFESEYLFCMCSVVTNLVTSLEIKPFHCDTMLSHFGRKRNGYVATQFILLSSTMESSAASGYAVVPEHFGQNEEPAGSSKEWTGKKPSFVPKTDLIDAIVFPSK